MYDTYRMFACTGLADGGATGEGAPVANAANDRQPDSWEAVYELPVPGLSSEHIMGI